MVCAPSNAAIDEIILRILDNGLLNFEGNKVIPNLLRIGPQDINSSDRI